MNLQDIGTMALEFLGDLEELGIDELVQVAIVASTGDNIMIRTTEAPVACISLLAAGIHHETGNVE